MSARALNWAWQQSPSSAQEKLVLAALADRADEEGWCFPSLRWIAAKCAPMSERSVRRYLDKLVESGLVAKVKRNRRGDGTLSTWVYLLPLSSGQQWPVDGPSPVANSGHAEPSKDLVSTDVLTQNGDSAQKDPFEELWDALQEHVQRAPAEKSPRSAYAKLAREMFDVGVTPEDVRRRAKRYRKRFPSMELTVAALAKWGEELDRGKRTLTEGERYPRGSTGGNGSTADASPSPSVSVLPPEENARRMRELFESLGIERCVHSKSVPGCPSCEQRALDGAGAFLSTPAPSSALPSADPTGAPGEPVHPSAGAPHPS